MDITILGEDIMITMVMMTDTLMTMDMIISTSTMSIRIKKNIYIVIVKTILTFTKLKWHL